MRSHNVGKIRLVHVPMDATDCDLLLELLDRHSETASRPRSAARAAELFLQLRDAWHYAASDYENHQSLSSQPEDDT